MSSRVQLPRLGVNIDHIATLRQLRGTPYPDVVMAAQWAEAAGADQITVHLREDRRHIQDADVKSLRAELRVPLNLEMAATDAMVKFARRIRPDWACLVPEKRQEVTTEGGLDLAKYERRIAKAVQDLKKAGTRVSLFIEPTPAAVKLSAELGADAVELHTGRYCLATQGERSQKSLAKARKELERIRAAGLMGVRLGIKVHAGHGLDYENTRALVDLEREGGGYLIEEYNIGHAIVCRAAMVGLERAVREMVATIKAP